MNRKILLMQNKRNTRPSFSYKVTQEEIIVKKTKKKKKKKQQIKVKYLLLTK